jgi:hypothetical protein
MLYGSCLCGYVPYACGLRSSPPEWIILRMACKRKLANSFVLFGRCDSSCMPDSGRKTWLRSYARLRLEDITLVVYPDSRRTSWFWSTSRLWLYLLTPVVHHGSSRWACHMSYHLSCERLCMTGLDDCSILQPRHLVKSRLGGTHDLFSIQNLNISWLCKFKCQVMCRVTNEH